MRLGGGGGGGAKEGRESVRVRGEERGVRKEERRGEEREQRAVKGDSGR